MNPKRSTPTDFKSEMSKVKERILNAMGKKKKQKQLCYMQGNPIRLSANFFFLSADISIETLQARGAGMLYSKCERKKLPTKNSLSGKAITQN